MKIAAKKTERGNATDKLFNVRPVFFAAIFLCLGIVFAYHYIAFDLSPLWTLLFVPIAACSLLLCENGEKRGKALATWSVLLVCFLLGSLLFSAKVEKFQTATAYNKETTVYGKVVKLSFYEEYAYIELNALNVDGERANGTLNAYLPTSFCENVRLADVVLLRGYLSTDTQLFNEYGFRAKDIRTERYYRLASIESCTVVEHTFDLFLFVRARMQDVVYAGMEKGSAAVTMAVLTGDTSGIEQNLYDNIRAGGIAHVFAVSGLHIGSLYVFCMQFMRKTRLRKLPQGVRFALTAAVLIFYTGICGFTASSVRAAVVCLVAYAATLLGVKKDFLQSLGISAILILLLSPTALFEAGFQLSFAACLGLALLTSPIQRAFTCAGEHTKNFIRYKLFKREREPIGEDEEAPIGLFARFSHRAASVLSVSLAAQVATAPILLYHFGYVSGWALLLNFLFVPIISATFALLLSCIALACVLPIACSGVLLYLPSVFWHTVLLAFEVLDFTTFAWTKPIESGALFAYYAGWLFTTDKWNLSKKTKRGVCLACFLTFAVTMVALNG